MLEDLALALGGKWEKLGRRLGFNQTTIENFDSAKRELEDKAFKMLMAWKQKEGSNATYKVLYDALCNKKVQCKLLAMRLSTPWPKSVCMKDSRLVSASFPLRLKMGKILFRE